MLCLLLLVGITGVLIYFFAIYGFGNPDGADCWIGFSAGENGTIIVTDSDMYNGNPLIEAEKHSVYFRRWFKWGFWIYAIQATVFILGACAVLC